MTAQNDDPGGRHTKSARIWDGTWKDLSRLGSDENFAPSTLIGDTADLLAGYFRCARCGGTPVPVSFGDLSGRPLREAVTEAEKAVRRQRCRFHKRVVVGVRQAPADTPPEDEESPAGAPAAVFVEPRRYALTIPDRSAKGEAGRESNPRTR